MPIKVAKYLLMQSVTSTKNERTEGRALHNPRFRNKNKSQSTGCANEMKIVFVKSANPSNHIPRKTNCNQSNPNESPGNGRKSGSKIEKQQSRGIILISGKNQSFRLNINYILQHASTSNESSLSSKCPIVNDTVDAIRKHHGKDLHITIGSSEWSRITRSEAAISRSCLR